MVLLAVSVTMCQFVHAAVISVQPVIAGYFTLDFVPLASLKGLLPGLPVVAQIDIMMEVVSLSPGEDSFGTAAFTLQGTPLPGSLGQAIPDIDAGGWAGNLIHVDTNGSAPGGVLPLFPLNADWGDNQDYIGILVELSYGKFANPLDPRRDVGEIGSSLGVPILLGSGFLEWNRLGEVSVGFPILEVSIKVTEGFFVPADSVPVQNVLLRLVPEPSSVVMFGGMLAVMGLRRGEAFNPVIKNRPRGYRRQNRRITRG
jgi:hypothetical protein